MEPKNLDLNFAILRLCSVDQ